MLRPLRDCTGGNSFRCLRLLFDWQRRFVLLLSPLSHLQNINLSRIQEAGVIESRLKGEVCHSFRNFWKWTCNCNRHLSSIIYENILVLFFGKLKHVVLKYCSQRTMNLFNEFCFTSMATPYSQGNSINIILIRKCLTSIPIRDSEAFINSWCDSS